MKNKTNKEVRIPQLKKVRKVYEEDGKYYITIDREWWSLDGYKNYLKDYFAINISYEFVGE